MKRTLFSGLVASAVLFSAHEARANVFCPEGFSYLNSAQLCVSDTEAIGPFTKVMTDNCKRYGGGTAACEGNRWKKDFAIALRGKGTCPMGAIWDPTIAACAEGENAFGPFRKTDVDSCKAKGGGPACESLRWAKSILPVVVADGLENKALFAFYEKSENYQRVYDNVMEWYGTTSNACIAFISTALRMSGVKIPQYGKYNGEEISLVTLPFSGYLQNVLGWKKITDSSKLLPGDVILTKDDSRYPGYPAHSYMFHSWKDYNRGIGYVVDNQGFTHERNIFGYGDFNFTPFAYGLRSPQ